MPDQSSIPDYPLSLDLRGRRVVVVGGGAVAERKVAGLRRAGAQVSVIAPRTAISDPEVTIVARPYAEGDLDGAWLAFACTDDGEVNSTVVAEATARRILCVRADRADAGTARNPAVARTGEVSVAVSSGDPGRSRALARAIGLLLDTGELPLRRQRPGTGWVALVGGGPGDPGLITVRGRQLLAQADVVVVDRLAPRDLLATLAPDVEVIDVGKRPHGGNSTSQERINEVLVDRAGQGKGVVRLKGGDPFVLGRGAEEFAACAAAGIDVHVVPGVSSALAGPASAGIPLTHRGIAADFTVVSAHVVRSTVDWQALAAGPATLVVLMAMDRLETVCGALIEHGRDPVTPAAVIQNATRPEQRVVISTLAKLAADAAAAGLGAPAIAVIGEVVSVPGAR
ncbi:MAG TPA: uroporphyrinogen-III C-methyltransferase [Mycobacteriales bacterium]|nr:uroporphyrinogen-III C-methyltransferase [Mycobacteriales bacterium]